MRLTLLEETFDLSNRAVFVINLGPWDLFEHNPLEEAYGFFVSSPPPGIDPVPDAKIIKVKPVNNEADAKAAGLPYFGGPIDTECHVEMSIESFIRNSIQYDIDPYEVLSQVKRFAGPRAARAAVQFIRTSPDLTVARFNKSGSSDQWPTQPQV